MTKKKFPTLAGIAQQKGFSRLQFATILGKRLKGLRSVHTVAHWMYDERRPSQKVRAKIEKMFGELDWS